MERFEPSMAMNPFAILLSLKQDGSVGDFEP